MSFIGNDSAKRYIRKLKPCPKKPWKKLFPNASDLVLDLLDKMLVFNPNERWSVDQCMAHKYFTDL